MSGYYFQQLFQQVILSQITVWTKWHQIWTQLPADPPRVKSVTKTDNRTSAMSDNSELPRKHTAQLPSGERPDHPASGLVNPQRRKLVAGGLAGITAATLGGLSAPAQAQATKSDPYAAPAKGALPASGFEIDPSRTALVVTDPRSTS